MLLIVVIALIATPAFHRRAKAVGIHAGKAACIPFVSAGVFFTLGNLAWFGLNFLFAMTQVTATTIACIWLMFNALVLLMYIALIHRTWKVLTSTIPPRNKEGEH